MDAPSTIAAITIPITTVPITPTRITRGCPCMDMAPARCIREGRYIWRPRHSGLTIIPGEVITTTTAGMAGMADITAAAVRITGMAADPVRRGIRECEAAVAGVRLARGTDAASRATARADTLLPSFLAS